MENTVLEKQKGKQGSKKQDPVKKMDKAANDAATVEPPVDTTKIKDTDTHTSLGGYPQERKKEMQQSLEKILERKIKLAEDPQSIVIAPKTRDCHLFTKILYVFDKIVNKIRLQAGTYIPLEIAVEELKKANECKDRLDTFIKSLDASGMAVKSIIHMETHTVKMHLANRKSTYVFLPKSVEGHDVAMLIKALDPLVIQFKTTCKDFNFVGELLKKLRASLVDFHHTTRHLAEVARVQYTTPKGGTFLDE